MEIIFAVGGIISGWMVIISKNPIHSVLSLVITFANLCMLLISLGLDYLPLLFIIVYVGAIAILFLFVIMMLNIKIVEMIDNATRYIPIGFFIGIIFIVEIYNVLNKDIKNLKLFEISNNFEIVKNINAIEIMANLLYSDFFLYFLLAAFILLVSMISAIILTIYHETDIKRQDLFAQITTKYDETIKYVK